MLGEYYRCRATQYDALYAEPERQADLAALRAWLTAQARGRHILEVACGTGYWTAVAAPVAAAVTATDLNAEMLAIARQREVAASVTWMQADLWHLPALPAAFDCGMAHLWWSHLQRAERADFLAALAARLESGATLLMIDETLVPQVGAPIARRDADGNTYQRRRLANGTLFEIVKNYPDAAELRADVATACDEIEILQLPHFWALRARFAMRQPPGKHGAPALSSSWPDLSQPTTHH